MWLTWPRSASRVSSVWVLEGESGIHLIRALTNLDLLEGLVQFLRTARDENDIGALGCQFAGCAQPHALRATRYEHRLELMVNDMKF